MVRRKVSGHTGVLDVLQAFRAVGDGWQTRIDSVLRDWLRTHSPV